MHSVKIHLPEPSLLPAEEPQLSWLRNMSNTPSPLSSWLFAAFNPGCPHLPCTGEPRPGHSTQMCLTNAEQRGGIISLNLLVRLILMEPRRLLSFFATSVHCWLMVHLLSTKILGSFSVSFLPSNWAQACVGAWAYFSMGPGVCSFPLLNSMRFPSAHFSSLLRSLWMEAQPSGVSATPPSFVLSADFPRVLSASGSSSLTKIHGTGPSIDIWGTPLMPGLQLDFGPLTTALWAPQFIQCSTHLTIHLSSWYFTSLLWETVLKAFTSANP